MLNAYNIFSNNMNIIIFSKNRACQLDLLIKSIKWGFTEFNNNQLKILYIYSTDEFKTGYDKVMSMHPDTNIIWNKEESFKIDLLKLVDKSEKYTVFFVDDDVFKEKFSINDKEFKYFDSHGDILCLSLRLHPRLTYCYPPALNQKPPTFNSNNVFLWYRQDGDYGYPMSLDGHIFRTKEILPILTRLSYNNPNSLESGLASKPLLNPKMICYDKSVIFNNPINKVQNWNNNIHGNITAETLNEQFLLNNIIDMGPFIGFENISCHQEVSINFIENNI